MVKTIVRVLVMSGVIAVFTTATQTSQAAGQDAVSSSNREQKSIVGSWLGTFDNGERLLMSFTSDGIALSSVQSEVSLIQPVLTPELCHKRPVGSSEPCLPNGEPDTLMCHPCVPH